MNDLIDALECTNTRTAHVCMVSAAAGSLNLNMQISGQYLLWYYRETEPAGEGARDI